jgi:hypothetical protein
MIKNRTSILRKMFFSTAIILLSCMVAHSALNPPPDFDTTKIHDITSLPLSSKGWTNFEAMVRNGYEEARVIFVSSSGGNDNTGQVYKISDISFDANGMFQSVGAVNAYKTIAGAYTQIRDGYPDILLLKRGDSWSERFTTASIGPVKSGLSKTARHIIASYGSSTTRPVLNTGIDGAIDSSGEGNIIISGIRFYCDGWESVDFFNTGKSISAQGSGTVDQLFEDCVWERYGEGVIQGGTTKGENIVIRRSMFMNGHVHDGYIYTKELTKFLFEENISYKPLDKSLTTGAITGGRHLYLSGEVDHEEYAELRGNIFYGGGRAIDVRCGGIITNNLISGDQVRLGGIGGSEGVIQGGAIRNNVFAEPYATNSSFVSIVLTNNENTIINNNIWTDPTGMLAGSYAIQINGDVTTAIGKNIEISDNIVYGYSAPGGLGRAFQVGILATEKSNIVIRNNDLQMVTGAENIVRLYAPIEGVSLLGNRYYSTGAASTWWAITGDTISDFADWIATTGETGASNTRVAYPDPTRTIKTYNATLGGSASTQEFMAETLNQSRQNWRPAYTADAVNNYIREGFSK